GTGFIDRIRTDAEERDRTVASGCLLPRGREAPLRILLCSGAVEAQHDVASPGRVDRFFATALAEPRDVLGWREFATSSLVHHVTQRLRRPVVAGLALVARWATSRELRKCEPGAASPLWYLHCIGLRRKR